MRSLYLDNNTYGHLTRAEADLSTRAKNLAASGWEIWVSHDNIREGCLAPENELKSGRRKLLGTMAELAGPRLLCGAVRLLARDLLLRIQSVHPEFLHPNVSIPEVDQPEPDEIAAWSEIRADPSAPFSAPPVEEEKELRQSEYRRSKSFPHKSLHTSEDINIAVGKLILADLGYERENEEDSELYKRVAAEFSDNHRTRSKVINSLSFSSWKAELTPHWLAQEWTLQKLRCKSDRGFHFDARHATYFPSVDGFVTGDSNLFEVLNEVKKRYPSQFPCNLFSRLSEVSF